METVNQEELQEKMFTQADVDKIVQDRVARANQKYAEALKAKEEQETASKAELQAAAEKASALQAELEGMKQADALRTMRTKVSTDTGVPVNLLTGSTEEECTAQAQAILQFAKPQYPTVPDGGEVGNISKPSTRQQFANWFDQL